MKRMFVANILGENEMSALQLWLQNHRRNLSQDAIDEALMEYIEHIEKQRDELLAAIETTLDENGHLADGDDCTLIALKRAIASVRGVA